MEEKHDVAVALENYLTSVKLLSPENSALRRARSLKLLVVFLEQLWEMSRSDQLGVINTIAESARFGQAILEAEEEAKQRQSDQPGGEGVN